jgi:hypothetical protein
MLGVFIGECGVGIEIQQVYDCEIANVVVHETFSLSHNARPAPNTIDAGRSGPIGLTPSVVSATTVSALIPSSSNRITDHCLPVSD